nr:MAG TPA: hypothetical protein [Caudoviricetes sp.]
MTIYIDSDFKCHAAPADGLTAVDTDFFDGKAPGYIEGYRFVPAGESWTREDGAVFAGEMASPWKDWTELDAVQREYEREQYNDLITKLSEVYEDA